MYMKRKAAEYENRHTTPLSDIFVTGPRSHIPLRRLLGYDDLRCRLIDLPAQAPLRGADNMIICSSFDRFFGRWQAL